MNDDTSILDHGDTRVLPDGHDAPAQVRDYVSAVRHCLHDLEPEELDDLTSGMHADLAELLAERGGQLEAILGSPARYAAELRSAAGLPESPSRRVRVLEVAELRRTATEVLGRLRVRWPWLGPTWAFIVTLRPAWWVLRGLLLAFVGRWLVGDDRRGLMPSRAFEWVAAAALVVASVWWARNSGRSRPAVLLTLAVNAVSVVALLGVLSTATATEYYESVAAPIPSGLFLDGSEVRNIYAYDADGKRLTDIRLFDDQGHPLAPYAVDASGTELAARTDRFGTAWNNVFPRPWLANLPPWVFTDGSDNAWVPPWVPPQLIAPLSPATPSAVGTPSASSTATSPTPTSPVASGTTTTPPPPSTAKPTTAEPTTAKPTSAKPTSAKTVNPR